jgi:hypothetical protein
MRIAGRNDKNAQGNVADQAQQAAGAGKKDVVAVDFKIRGASCAGLSDLPL